MDTRDDIVFWADSLIRRKGFNGFSYTDIAERLEIRNAAIHYHFPAKADLGKEVINREWMQIKGNRRLYSEEPGDEQLKKLIVYFYSRHLDNEVCMNGALIPDYYTFTPRMKAELEGMSNEIMGWATDCLRKGREEGLLRFNGTPEDRALLLMSTLISSLLLARIFGPTAFRRTVDQLLADMGISWTIEDLSGLREGPDGVPRAKD